MTNFVSVVDKAVDYILSQPDGKLMLLWLVEATNRSCSSLNTYGVIKDSAEGMVGRRAGQEGYVASLHH